MMLPSLVTRRLAPSPVPSTRRNASSLPLALAFLLIGAAVLPRSASAVDGPFSSPPNVKGSTLPPRGGKLVAALARAEAAWRLLSDPATTDDAFARAQTDYAHATGEVLAGLNGAARARVRGNVPRWNWQHEQAAIGLGPYRLALASPRDTPGIWQAGTFDKLWWVERPAINPTIPQAVRPGVGAYALGVQEGTPERRRLDPGLPKRGYFLPVTAVLDFRDAAPPAADITGTPREVRLRLYDPRVVREVVVGRRGRHLPLAVDVSTPARQEIGVRNFGQLSLVGTFRPEWVLDRGGLFFFGPYDPSKVPVVFIHGLKSDPSIFENATADLFADPETARRYQPWYFFYPTGSAVTASADRLRVALDAARARYDPGRTNPNMDRLVLVAHSLGGLVAQLQVVEPGNELYNAYFSVPIQRLRVPEAFRTRLRRNLYFRSRRDVREVVFICTPHRGTLVADLNIVQLGARLIAIPKQVLSAATQILTLNTDSLSPAMRRSGLKGLSAVDWLSPRNPYFGALEKLPIQASYDSIIADGAQTDHPLRERSDGSVGYWSAHLDGARTETVVHHEHVCMEKAEVVAQVHAILRREMGGKEPATNRRRLQRPRTPRFAD